MDHRDRMIDKFTHDPDVRVFLMSLKAGGVALNLTAASHVMLMDPWYAVCSTLSAMQYCRWWSSSLPVKAILVMYIVDGFVSLTVAFVSSSADQPLVKFASAVPCTSIMHRNACMYFVSMWAWHVAAKLKV